MSPDGQGAPAPRIRSLAGLTVPRRTSGVAYAEGEDHDAEALLTLNGHGTGTEELIVLLRADLGILQAAAARTLGARRARAAIDALERLAGDVGAEETARVQAAYALARMDAAPGQDVLLRLLELPPETTPAPLQAAGALARLGDPRGFALVRTALDSQNSVTAMVACKQLYAFVPHEGASLPEGGRVQAFEAFRRALERPEPNISGEARAQLEELATEEARAVLESG